MGLRAGVIRGPSLADLRMTDKEVSDDKELAEWELFSEETGHEHILGDPNDLDEEEKLRLVRKYAPNVAGRARVFDKKSGKHLRSFYDPDSKKHYVYRPPKGIFKLDIKTGRERFVGGR